MSKEMAVAFIEKARNEVGIQEKVLGINTSSDFDKFIELASSLGYPFTEQDFSNAARDVATADGMLNEELSEGELETVAGGSIKNYSIAQFSGTSVIITSAKTAGGSVSLITTQRK